MINNKEPILIPKSESKLREEREVGEARSRDEKGSGVRRGVWEESNKLEWACQLSKRVKGQRRRRQRSLQILSHRDKSTVGFIDRTII